MISERQSAGSAKIKVIFSMLIFGTIGLFVRCSPLPSSVIALVRGVIGMLFLLLASLLRGKRLSAGTIKKNGLFLVLSGAALGMNWILLFEAYRYTTVAVATLCYYIAPVFVILLSPVLLKEKLTARKGICVLIALAGMVLVSGAAGTGLEKPGGKAGIVLGLAAAVLYACVVLLNKKIWDISVYDRTIVQLGVSSVALFPYVMLTEGRTEITIVPQTVFLLLVVGILHTGIAYGLYFSGIRDMEAQTAAIFSYLDPVTAILWSALLLREPMGRAELLGAVLILGSTCFSERSGAGHRSRT